MVEQNEVNNGATSGWNLVPDLGPLRMHLDWLTLKSLLHNLESDLKTHVSVDHVVRKC
jgi:hypothetical protein